MLKRFDEGFQFVRAHAQCTADCAPLRYRALDFANDTARGGGSESKIRRGGHQGINRGIGAAVFGNPGLEFAGTLGKWVEVEGGRESPAARLHVQESVVVQVVVDVGDEDVEGDAPP